MDQVTLTIPISKSLKQKVESKARKHGMTLTEIVQNLLSRFANRDVVILSPRADRRYAKMDEYFRIGKNIHTAKNIDELMSQLTLDK